MERYRPPPVDVTRPDLETVLYDRRETMIRAKMMEPHHAVTSQIDFVGWDNTGDDDWWNTCTLKEIYGIFSQVNGRKNSFGVSVPPDPDDDPDEHWPTYEEWRASLTPGCHWELREP